MQKFQYLDKKQHGTPDFPVEYYFVDSNHPRYTMAFHWHQEWELLRVLEGKFLLSLDDTTYTLSAGDAVLISPETLHGGEPEDWLFDGAKKELMLRGETTEDQVLGGFGDKLWWIHSEALYTTLRLYQETGDERFFQWHEKVFEYVFRVFPNRDSEIREWKQICMRDGRPQEKVVALPVKDPFHITRNLIKCYICNIYHHHHVKISINDCLTDIQNIYIIFR